MTIILALMTGILLTMCGNGAIPSMLHEDFYAGSEIYRLGAGLTGIDDMAGMSENAVIEKTEVTLRENGEQKAAERRMKIQAGDTIFTATLEDNSSVDALKELMADGPLTLNMRDYAGMEKGADLGVTLPENNKQINTQAGDMILYQGRTFVIYYDTNSWSLTPIGKIDNVDADELRRALGTSDVTVTLFIE